MIEAERVESAPASEKLVQRKPPARAMGKASDRVHGMSHGLPHGLDKGLGITVRVARKAGRGAKAIGGRGRKSAGRLGQLTRGQADLDEGFDAHVADATRKAVDQAARKGAPKVLRAGWRGAKTTVRGGVRAYQGGRAAVNGTRAMFARTRSTARAGRHAAVTARQGATGALRAAQAVNAAVRFAGAKIGAMIASLASAPILMIVAVVAVVIAVVVSILAWIPGMATESEPKSLANVPSQYVAVVMRAGSICDIVTPQAIAAQIEQESNWNPQAGSSAGAQGISQFMPSTWKNEGKDGDGDGKADILNPIDAIWSQGNYMCGLASQIQAARKAGKVDGDPLDLTLAAYNAGVGKVYGARGVPKIAETEQYVRRIRTLMPKYAATGGGEGMGAKVGALKPALVMQPDGYHVNVQATGTDTHAAPTYDTFQCTWWAAIRRAQIGKPVDGHMGNGGVWAGKARTLGYPMGGGPQPGDAISFHPGVHGSDGTYGHVAIIEEVKPDGSIVISQSGTGWMAVVIETISKQQLDAMGSGIDFIH